MLILQRTAFIIFALFLSAFTLQPSIIPTGQIISGGPPKDGIPALTYPKHEAAVVASSWLNDDDMLLGITFNGESRAYPIRILNWHEIVNDRISSTPLVISYCPLCGSGVAFKTSDRFGVSGLLYQSDVLLYDHKTESLWSQLLHQAVAGKRAGEKLTPYPLVHTTWKEWRKLHPDTLVLSRHTGYARDYNQNPYQGYDQREALYFDVAHRDTRLHSKAWVVGATYKNHSKAWPVDSLKDKGTIYETWHGMALTIRYIKAGNRIEIIHKESGEVFPALHMFWFAWAAFHPDTELYLPEHTQIKPK